MKSRSFPRHLPGPGDRNRDPVQRDATDYVRQMEAEVRGYKRMAILALNQLPDKSVTINTDDLTELDELYELVVTTSWFDDDRSGVITATSNALPAQAVRVKRTTRFRD